MVGLLRFSESGQTMIEKYLLLVHGPVLGASGDEITTAVTPLDISDIARTVRTYGFDGYGIVQPQQNQRALVHRMHSYWLGQPAESFSRSRPEALQIVRTFATVEEAIEFWGPGMRVATSALAGDGTISWSKLRDEQGQRMYYLFGTGYGLLPSMVDSCDHIAPAIAGVDGYAHLSVRSAVAIILDRITRP